MHPGRPRSGACDTLRPEARPHRYLRLGGGPGVARAAPSPPRGGLRKPPALKGRWDRGPAGPARGGADDLRFRFPPPPCPQDRCSASAGGAALTHVLGGAETGDVAWGIDPYPHGSTGVQAAKSASPAAESGVGWRARCGAARREKTLESVTYEYLQAKPS